MEPYHTLRPDVWRDLPETERLAARIIVLPTGQSVTENAVAAICGIIRAAVSS